MKATIEQVIQKQKIQNLLNEDVFHFQKLLDVKEEFEAFEISDDEIDKLIKLRKNSKLSFEDFINSLSGQSKEFIDLMGDLIAYLDKNASGIRRRNQYADNRAIAKAFVRQNIWVNHLLKFKKDSKHLATDNIQNALEYANNPNLNFNILSNEHRKELIENLCQKKYQPEQFNQDLIELFKPYPLFPKNSMNLTHIIACIVYDEAVKKLWKSDKSSPSTITSNDEIKHPMALNQILFGPPGTGKTYHTKKLAVEIIDGKSPDDRTQIIERYKELFDKKQIQFITFHQSMSYEDFVEGIKPETDNGSVTYEVQDGIFKEMCINAAIKKSSNFDTAYENLIENLSESDDEYLILKTKRGNEFRVNVNREGNLTLYTTEKINKQGSLTESNLKRYYGGEKAVFKDWRGYANGVIDHLKTNYQLSQEPDNEPDKKYVLIIDEINRGNVSAIFGELITLLEADKRQGAANGETITVTLPYSKDKFSVPVNLHIIGTMNTADRSVEALDTALRRRFSFVEMLPKPDLLKDTMIEGIDLAELLKVINQRIELLLDKNHTIGHSYFLNVNNLGDLKSVFANKVIPLLEEYFYGDFGKIGLILGSAFVTKTADKDKISFAKFDYGDEDILRDRTMFKFTPQSEWNIESFTSIYNKKDA